MTSISIGRVCVKLAGRNAGKYCIITKIINDTFVEITGPKKLNGIKTKRCNVQHLEPLEFLLNIKENATEAQIEKELQRLKLGDLFKKGVRIK